MDSAVINNPKKKETDSAVIYYGFCGYLSWILWLSGTNIGLRDASASKKQHFEPDFCPHRFRIDGPSLMGHKEVCGRERLHCTGFGRRCFDISTQKRKSFVFL